MERAAEGVGSSVVDALWLDTLERIAGRVAHEVKGALNGVAVNLEVIRTRAEKPGAPAASVGSFATAAASQLEALIVMTDAVLAVTRPVREPVELGQLLVRMTALLVPAARADGRSLRLDETVSGLDVTSASGNAVRLATGACLLAAIEQSSEIRCTGTSGAAGSELTIHLDDVERGPPVVDPEVVSVAADAGIQIVAESAAMVISFPR